MVDKIDWRLKFTDAFRKPHIQEIITREIFHDKSVISLERDGFEQIIVQCCALIMEEVERER